MSRPDVIIDELQLQLLAIEQMLNEQQFAQAVDLLDRRLLLLNELAELNNKKEYRDIIGEFAKKTWLHEQSLIARVEKEKAFIAAKLDKSLVRKRAFDAYSNNSGIQE